MELERRKKELEILKLAEKERERLREKGYSESYIKSMEVWATCPYCGNEVLLDHSNDYSKGDRIYACSKSGKNLKPRYQEKVSSSGCISCGETFWFIVDDEENYR